LDANFNMSKVGFPIRKSSDQRLFAPSRSISQRTTSFIASYRQGIHQMPLSHLIALISNTHQAKAQPISLGKEGRPEHLTLYVVRIAQKDRFIRSVITTKQTNQKSIRLNPNIHLTAEICADSAGYAPQALVPLYNVNCLRVGARLTTELVSLQSQKNKEDGGARRDRTDDLMLAKHALSQLSYGPELKAPA
jgi:hypothetical protein